MSEFFRRLRYLLNRTSYDNALENEMEFHREMAARQGRKNFGNTLRLREQSREAWGWTWIDRLMQDLRYAARILWRAPGFTLTAVLVLALGIGVNVTAFSLFNLIALKPLPVRDPDSIVMLQRRSPENINAEMPYPTVAFYRDHARTLKAVMAMMGAPPMELEQDTQPIRDIFVTANYFSELGTQPALGRLLDPTRDDTPGAPPVAVLSYGFWQRRFGGDPSIAGRVIHLNKKPAVVIGVVPANAASLNGQHADVWLPLMQQPYFVEGSHALTDPVDGSVRMWARLAPGVTAKMAEQELLALTGQVRKQWPKAVWDNEYIRSDPGGRMTILEPGMYQVFALIGVLVLLILAVACANLGGLMMARGVARKHEIGIRIAIGANRKRIFRQLFTESLLLALLGTAVGLGMSYVVIRVVLTQLLENGPGWMSAAPDWRVLLFALGMAMAATVFFGFTPALQIARQKQRRTTARKLVVGAQVAASCVLLIVAALLVRAVLHVLYTDPGFGYEQVLGINPGLDNHGYTPEAARVYLDELKTGLSGIPGVTSVALSSIPLLGNGATTYMTVGVHGKQINIYPDWVDADFFTTMSIPLVRGRNFLPGETNAVIVSQSLARKLWPGEDPIGKPLWPDDHSSKDVIVGVAGNARVKSMSDGDAVEAYWPAQSSNLPAMTLLVKTAGAPDGLPPQIKTMVERLDPKLFPYIWLLKSGFRENTTDLEKIAMLASLLGMVAVSLAGVGIVGLVAYTVSQRTKEIAIRIALGARPLHVVLAILRQFVVPVFAGLAVGTAATAGLSQFLRKTLYGVSNLDPAGYAGGIGVLLAIAVMAALLPARRALRVDPVQALHEE